MTMACHSVDLHKHVQHPYRCLHRGYIYKLADTCVLAVVRRFLFHSFPDKLKPPPPTKGVFTHSFRIPSRRAITAQSEMSSVRPRCFGWLMRVNTIPRITESSSRAKMECKPVGKGYTASIHWLCVPLNMSFAGLFVYFNQRPFSGVFELDWDLTTV